MLKHRSIQFWKVGVVINTTMISCHPEQKEGDKNTIERLNPPAGGGKFKDCKNIILVNGNYADLPEILKENKLPKADGLLLDLGMSSDQLEHSGRGFSFLRDEPLIMTYRTNLANRFLTAAEVVNSFSGKELADIFWEYGEERYSRQIAKNIVEERNPRAKSASWLIGAGQGKKRILTTFELVEIIKKAVPKNYEQGRIHPATKVFQALRIYVNGELDNLEKLLKNLTAVLKPNGRAVIISFHSLEDRLVKNNFRQMVKERKAEFLAKKPIRPSIEEIRNNLRARSAKMRAIKII